MKGSIAVALSTLALGLGTACQASDAPPEEEEIGSTSQALCSTPDQVHPLDFVLARLGTTVLDCKGSIHHADFFVNQQGFLETSIRSCPLQENLLQDLMNLLQLQQVPESGAKEYFAGHWAAWNLRYSKNPVACPADWKLDTQIDPPTPDNANKSMQGCRPSTDPSEPATCGTVPQKLKVRWRITGPSDCQGDSICAVRRARLCSDWFGARWLVSAIPRMGLLTTDPSWWTSNTLYAPGTNPFDPALGYQHQMATSGLPPGEIWGAINRANEFCTRYTADLTGIVWYRRLTPVNCGGGWMCATRCQ